MKNRFAAETEEDGHVALPVHAAHMTVNVTVPAWKDLMCLDILVEAQQETEGCHPLWLVFSSQWMDVPVAALEPADKAVFDGLHVTWPQNSVNDPLQPPASVYDGTHGMVTAMDLRLTHKVGAVYRLIVSGAAEFAPSFHIDTDMTLAKISVMDDARTANRAVEDWFQQTFKGRGMEPAWRTVTSANGDLYFYEAPCGQQTGTK